MKSGIDLIARERQEQLKRHGMTTEHDLKEHESEELAYNASILAAPDLLYCRKDNANTTVFSIANIYEHWKLPDLAYKANSNIRVGNSNLPRAKRIKQLAVAGALIAAEIDRLNNEV